MSQPNNVNPNLVEIGAVPPEVVSAVQGMNDRNGQILMEIGRLEIRKLELINESNRLQATANRILKGESDRMGIPPGQAWSLTPDGKALVPAPVAEAIQAALAQQVGESLNGVETKGKKKDVAKAPPRSKTPEG